MKNETEVQEALMAEIDQYSRIFWTDKGREFWYDAASEAGYKRIPIPDASDREELTAQYKKDLMFRFEKTIFPAVNRYYRIKAQAEYEAQLEKTMQIYNRVTKIKLIEDIASGKDSQYAGYTWRLADLAEGIDKSEWSGTISPTGETSIPISLIGFIMAGKPDKVELYKPGADDTTATPVETLSFKFDYPEVTLRLDNSTLEFSDLVGDYPDGTMTIVDLHLSEHYLSTEDSDPDDDEFSEGCDLSSINLSEFSDFIGLPMAMPFRITATAGEENAGLFVVPEEEESTRCEYNPETNILTVTFVSDDMPLTFHFSVKLSDDKSRILLEGQDKNMLMEDDDSYMIVKIKGSKEFTAKHD